MANSAQATKRARQNIKRAQDNASKKSALRTAIKKTASLARTGDSQSAQLSFQQAVRLLDKAGRKGIIHMKKASRLKKRLHQKLKIQA